eukprot:TRINITY_DN3941_c0_g1_i2.p1 TRINITY_DN3941_c0_g1~~TRINITY_DN3941_c0_g1_i2.p1  ORF type:complete len:243 (-),score=32.25 TRINITY_DN3941_c0_g1_i2:590-1318(-)
MLIGFCIAQGLFLQYFQIATFCWITIIAFDLWMIVVRKRTRTSFLEKFYHIGAWVTALLFALFPLVTSSYGLSGIWCWIVNTDTASSVWRFLVFYIPLYLMILVVIVLYVMIIYNVIKYFKKSDTDDKSKKRVRRQLNRLKLYPIIFLLLYIFPIINRIYDWSSDGDQSFFLFLMQALTAPLLGFANGIVYVGLDPEMRRSWKNFLFTHGCCTKYTEPKAGDGITSSESESFDSVDLDIPIG